MKSSPAFDVARAIYLLLLVLCAAITPQVQAFVPTTPAISAPYKCQQQQQHRPFTTTGPLHVAEADSSSLLDEFRLYNGELVDPYKILKVEKKADRTEIRKKYIDLSKRYHPDAAMHRDILPGSCNNEDDVRLHWERIKLSYEILSNRKMRTRYDRNVVIADPGAAMQRAAINAAGGAAMGVAGYVGKGIFAVGKGLFSVGAKAVSNSMKDNNNKDNKGDQAKPEDVRV